MEEKFTQAIIVEMQPYLNEAQLSHLTAAISNALVIYTVEKKASDYEQRMKDKTVVLKSFICAKKVEGCSDKTLSYYESTIWKVLSLIDKNIEKITTDDIRQYLSYFKESRNCSKVTIDNIRRILSSFFSWLEDEDYIPKNPVRRIHKVRTDSLVKEIINDESMEILRDACTEIRDLSMIDLLVTSGIRVGELVRMNISDIDFHERQCVVFGKGNKEREVYFNARTKIHLQNYIQSRKDNNPALFVSLSEPHSRLSISGVEKRIKLLGQRANLAKMHPHKFRRTFATTAIDRGMPIEQVQHLLGHVKMDTTLQYAMVNRNNVKISHRKFIC
jgi:site-specific recombinase XerD